MTINREEMIDFLKALSIQDNDGWDDVYEKIKSTFPLRYKEIKVSDGATKICLIFKKYSFVIKWAMGNSGEAVREAVVYRKAVTANLAKFFPETEVLARINGIDFVVQEKVDFSCDDLSYKQQQRFDKISKTATDKIVEKIQKDFFKVRGGYHRSLNERWAKMAIVLYGKKACKSLCAFVIENGINDLHYSNLGYLHGKPMILDFSGYHR